MARARKSASIVFDALTLEGGLIAPAMLARIAARDAGKQSESDYGTPKGLTIRDEMARYFRIGQALFADFSASENPSAAATVSFVETLMHEVFDFPVLARTSTRTLHDHLYAVTLEALDGRVPIVVVPPADNLDRASDHLPTDGRRVSAATAIQDWLNANEDALWGFCCNGEHLRLVRDNASLTRPAYLEANLRQIFEAENFADFAALWLLIHASRFGLKGAPVSDCALEHWRETGSKEGVAARDRLRDGVEAALLALGNGFLAHPQNKDLRERIEKGELPLTDYFGQLLRLVYRLIFLLAAEDRNLLHAPNATIAARKLYADGYSLDHLRKQSIRRAAWDRHHDRWEGLLIVFAALARGEPKLGLPALGGLFGADAMSDLTKACLTNRALMEAVYRLAWLKEDARMTPINWRDMETEELGSVYESLLELTPRLVDNGRSFGFAEGAEAKGNARKTTGSYYTPDSLVQALLDSALDPVLDRVESESENPTDGLLSVTAIDPACGSGHFLLAAARRIATRVARIRAGGVASAEDYRHALRDVVRSCIYGVDRNPMAVELTKVALWIETVEPGKPLGFLDANIRCGDALLGVFDLEALREGIPDAAYKPLTGDDKETAKYYAQRNKAEKEGQGELGLFGEKSKLPPPPPLAKATKSLRALPEDSVKDIAEKKQKFDAALNDPIRWKWRVAADMYVAAFLAPKVGGEPPSRGAAAIPTTAHVWEQLSGGQSYGPLVGNAQSMAGDAHAFHWSLEFPEIMEGGGFDVVLGNPPWDKIQAEEQSFFSSRLPELAQVKGQKRKRLIEELSQTNPILYAEFQKYKRSIAVIDTFAKQSGRYPLTGKGKLNTYALFSELNSVIVGPKGRCGVILPIGIVTDDTTKDFFGGILNSGRLCSVSGFENEEFIFPAVHHAFRFIILTIAGSSNSDPTSYVFFCRSITDLSNKSKAYNLTLQDVRKINPNTGNAPIFRSDWDAVLNRKIYNNVPVFVNETGGINPWNANIRRMFNPTDDSDLFEEDPDELNDPVPLYESKMIHQYDHRFGTYEGQTEAQERQGKLPETTEQQHADPQFKVRPKYWTERELAESYIGKQTKRNWLIGFRDITNSTSYRTTIACILPRIPTVDPCRNIYLDDNISAKEAACLLACLNSTIFDYFARQKVSGNHLAIFIFKQLPVLPPSSFDKSDLEFIVPRVLELTYTSNDMGPFARDLGYDAPPFKWNEERRSILRAELDARIARIYGLTYDELRFVLDPADVMGPDYPSETFRVLKEREIKEHGEYRTQKLVLEAWDRMYGDVAQTPAPIIIQIDPSTLPDDAWVRYGDGPDALLAQLAAIIKTLPGPVPIAKVRLATLYAWEPHYLSNRLDEQDLDTWQRLVGPSAAPRTGTVTALSPRINASWRDAVRQLVGIGAIVEDINSQTWAPGTGLDDYVTTAWPDGRAGFVMKALEKIALNDAAADLPAEDQNWVLANAA